MTLPTHAGKEDVQDVRIMEALYWSAREGRPVQPQCLDGCDLLRGKKPARIERERA